MTSTGVAVRLHDLTASPGVHVLFSRDAEAVDPARVSVHRLTSQPGQGILAVRPDGYVGFRSERVDAAQLGAWLDLVRAR